MPSGIRVVDQKFFSKYNNGETFSSNTSDFARHLKGGVLENVKAVFTVQNYWFTTLINTTFFLTVLQVLFD